MIFQYSTKYNNKKATKHNIKSKNKQNKTYKHQKQMKNLNKILKNHTNTKKITNKKQIKQKNQQKIAGFKTQLRNKVSFKLDKQNLELPHGVQFLYQYSFE